jgi:hypothetical protein
MIPEILQNGSGFSPIFSPGASRASSEQRRRKLYFRAKIGGIAPTGSEV